MIREVLTLRESKLHRNEFLHEAVRSFLELCERALGTSLFVAPSFPGHPSDITDLLEIRDALLRAGILKSLRETTYHSGDEPRLFSWYASFSDDDAAGGSSAVSQRRALLVALAECVERYVWMHEIDTFDGRVVATVHNMRTRGAILPERFAGFPSAQRRAVPLTITEDSSFEWVTAQSLTSGRPTFIPMQTVSGNRQPRHEALIRPIITTGIATHETRDRALLGGALEVIERDAYMIMWLNQLSLPLVDIENLRAQDQHLETLLQLIERYRLSVHVVRLITDAPAYVVCAVIRDASSVGVPVVIGLGSGTTLARTIAHAIEEGLRIRKNFREYWMPRTNLSEIRREEIRHEGHGLYWLYGTRHTQLDFLTRGAITAPPPEAWENDTPEQHLRRIVSWCSERKYEFLAVDFGHSKLNPTPWAIEHVVIPDMQPMHLVEKYPCIGGHRLTEVPQLFGYAPRNEPFIDEPHPFV